MARDRLYPPAPGRPGPSSALVWDIGAYEGGDPSKDALKPSDVDLIDKEEDDLTLGGTRYRCHFDDGGPLKVANAVWINESFFSRPCLAMACWEAMQDGGQDAEAELLDALGDRAEEKRRPPTEHDIETVAEALQKTRDRRRRAAKDKARRDTMNERRRAASALPAPSPG